jgi:protein-S-isoprenylcysteine O-methyltransferase Ste14
MNILSEPWAAVFFVGFVIYTATRGAYARRLKNIESVHRQVDRLEKALLLMVIPASLLLPLLYLFTPLLNFANYRLPAFAPWVGLVLLLAALWLFWRSHADLGQNWSVTLEVRKEHRLITHGVYRFIRHPMYASIFLFSLAQGLLLANWLAGWSAFVPFTVLYLVRTPREEQMMCKFFGDEYRDYMRRTGRLFPRIGMGK